MSDTRTAQDTDDFFDAPMTEAEYERAMALTDEELAEIEAMQAPPETISVGELLLLNIETRIGRIADALETANKIKAVGRDDIVGLTAQVNRLADAFDSIAAVLGCVTESVEGEDGISRCVIRTRDTVPNSLSQRDDRD